MKKNYLLALGCISASLFAQGPAEVSKGASSTEAQIAQPEAFLELQPTISRSNQLQRRGVNYAGFVKIGETYYDLQTNSAMPHRIILNNDGTIATTWTTSPTDATGFPQRGSGFNFMNSAGSWMPFSSTRVEASDRTGWPNLATLSDGNTITIGHFATSGGFYRTASQTPGTKPSGASQNILVESPYKPIWGRMDNNGDTLHLIASYTDSARAGESRAPTRNGIFSPMVYSRSFDGGLTWNKAHTLLPGYDSSIIYNGGADRYAIEVKGSTVAIITGGLLNGVVLWKSTDAGESFSRIIADSFPYAPYESNKLMLDTPYSCDGTVDVLIDNDGKVHAFWGLGRVFDDDTTDESYSLFPGLQGLVHWKEGDPAGGRLIAAGGAFDRDGDDINGLRPATVAGLGTNGIPQDNRNLATVARLTNTSALRQPSAGIDANGDIYVSFSVPIEFDVSDLDANYRDIGLVYSTDGGNTWSAEQNVTQALKQEDDFACIAKKVDDHVHMIWQADDQCGNNLSNDDPNFGNHPVALNTIYYQAIPVADIKAGTIGMQYGLSTKNPNTGNVSIVSNYPNPFTGTTNVMIYISQPGKVGWQVKNINGQLVKSGTASNLVRGNHVIKMDCSGLPSGVYTYTLISGGSSASKKMIIE